MATVVIVGGGPVGMLLATELGLRNVPTTVFETRTETHDEPRAGTLHARTVQSLFRRGYLTGTEQPDGHDPNVTVRVPFHFGGRSVLTLESPAVEGPPMVVQPQADIERFFEAKAHAAGVTIRRGHQVTNVVDHGEYVAVTVQNDGRTSEVEADYVVGCDGARSVVRDRAGIASTTHPATFAGILGLVRLLDPASCPPGWSHGRTGWTLINVHPTGLSRVLTHDFTEPLPDRNAPVELDELQSAASRIVGRDLPMTQPEYLGRFSDFARLADTYRRGRVLLAGDAAHVHAPLGGQGLNLGMQDAVNLGWKLAMVGTGVAPDTVLDSYHTERHPVASAVIANTRAQAALMRPTPEFDPLRELIADLLSLPESNRRLSDLITGQSVRYADGPGPTGSFLPNLPVDHRTVGELLRPGRPVLLLRKETAPEYLDAAVGWTDRVDTVTHAGNSIDEPALLCRPDGYVAWAGSGARRLAEALTHWFGPGRQ